ncbi:plexin-B3-like [Saccostrea cucullata]|uniref:plexin-B3-like n=1 Tax=Saccostrea cuccullata TaxID=36930 RepID=UPI002ED34041
MGLTLTPSIQMKPVLLKRARRNPRVNSVQLGFYMDNVPSVQDLKTFFPGVQSILYYAPDPVILDFEESGRMKAYTQGIVLEIKGRRLNAAATRENVDVFVGAGRCKVTSVNEESIYCNPPTDQPALRDDGSQRSDGIPRVFVKFGNLEKMVGFLKYKEAEEKNLIVYTVREKLISFVYSAAFLSTCKYRSKL